MPCACAVSIERGLGASLLRQSLFRTDVGLEPFIGVIVSPYDDRRPTEASAFQILSMDMRATETAGLGTVAVLPRRLGPAVAEG